MGKSTFIVHLIRRYINKYNKKSLPYPIKLVNCGEKTEDKDNYIINRINNINDKNNTILIIDALDESNAAISNFNDFFSSLRDLICQFRIVVLTCRTQFFEKYEDEPSLLPTRDPKTKKQKQFKKYYVSPFYDYEIQHYLNKKYLLKFLAKKKAKLIVEKCGPLMARPLLLSYIDDLVNSDIKNYTISKIYERIIDKWLEREANFAVTNEKDKDQYKKDLFSFSSEIALCIAQNHENEGTISDIINKYSSIIKEKNLKGRSLLNRNSKNEYKFAHKSFMEYLVAKQLFENKNIPLDSIDCISNDMIPKFLVDIIALEDKGYNYIKIVFSSTISWKPQNSYYNTNTIFISCDVTDNNIKYLLELLQPKYSIGIIEFDCNYDYSKTYNLLEQYSKLSHYQLKFWNYNFRDDSIINIIKPLLYSKLYKIDFYIKDKQTFDTGAIEVLKFLWYTQHSYPRFPSTITILVHYLQNGQYIDYIDAFSNKFLLEKIEYDMEKKQEN